MRKRIIIMAILTFFTIMSVADTSETITPIKECIEPFEEYTYYLHKSKIAQNSDMKDRFKSISDDFYKLYKNCTVGVQTNFINKSNKFQTYKSFEQTGTLQK